MASSARTTSQSTQYITVSTYAQATALAVGTAMLAIMVLSSSENSNKTTMYLWNGTSLARM